MQGQKDVLIKTLGEIIKKHRKNIGKTIYKISAECSMSKSTWREAELGVCKDINLSTLWKIAEGLGVKPAIIIEELYQAVGSEFSLCDFEN